MRTIFTFVIIFFTYINWARAMNGPVADLIPQLSYARYCADSLNQNAKAIHIYTELIHLLDETANDSLRLVAETERINLLQRMGRRKEVIENLPSSINLAYKLKNYEYLSGLLETKAYIYLDLGFLRAGKNMLIKASRYASQIENEAAKNLHLGNLEAIKTLSARSTEEKIFFYKNAYTYFSRVSPGNTIYQKAQLIGNACNAAAFIQRGSLDSAQVYLEKSVSYIKTDHFIPEYYPTIAAYACVLHAKQEYSEAERWLHLALEQAELSENTYQQKKMLERLYQVKIKRADNEIVDNRLLKYATLSENLDQERRYNINLIENELEEQNNQLLIEASEKQTPTIMLLSGATFLLCLTIGGLYLKQRRAIQPALIQEETLPKDINRSVNIEEIQELNILAKQNDASFLLRFQEYYPTFSAKINAMANTPLNHAELEICACTKLNFSTKDIALYRNYSVRSVENRKYRIRKKLTLDSDTDFVVWIAGVH